MKKILILTMIFILAITFTACGKEFNFKYQLQDKYQNKVDEKLLEEFIIFTKDTTEIYETGLDDIKIYDVSKTLDIGMLEMYMYDTVNKYNSVDIWNIYEDGILSNMEEQRSNLGKLSSLTLTYSNWNNGLSEDEDYTQEYFDEELKTIKKDLQSTLEYTQQYLK